MSHQEYEPLVFRIEQLEHNQRIWSRYMAQMKRQLYSLNEQFNNRFFSQQNSSLQEALTQLQQQFAQYLASPEALVDVVKEPLEEVSGTKESQPPPTILHLSESQLVFDRFGSRAVLLEALEKAQERLILVCPWLNRNSIDADLLQKFRDCLNRNCCIEIGWGHLSDRGKIGKGWRYDALRDLRQLERDYPERFQLQLLGTHEKFLVCDHTFAMVGSHNLLTSSTQSPEREVGIRTTDPQVIQGLIDRFDGAKVLEAQTIGENQSQGEVGFAEAMELQQTTEEFAADMIELDDWAPDEDTDDLAEASQGAAVDAEEFWIRCNNNERNFIGTNLARVELTGRSLFGLNLSKANLKSAQLSQASLASTNLSYATLEKANLNQVNLRSANLRQANLSFATLVQAALTYTDLTEAKLSYANLTAANLQGTNLHKANLENANLSGAYFEQVNLTQAKLDQVNLCEAHLVRVNLVGANLNYIDFSKANLSQANLCSVSLQQANLSGANLTKADLRGANLERANLEKVNLTGANISGVRLEGTKLSGAIMPDGTIYE